MARPKIDARNSTEISRLHYTGEWSLHSGMIHFLSLYYYEDKYRGIYPIYSLIIVSFLFKKLNQNSFSK